VEDIKISDVYLHQLGGSRPSVDEEIILFRWVFWSG
jgi:hypothetical protein